MSNTKDTPARQPSFYRSPSNDYEEGYRDAKKEMDALKLELQKQKELNAELVKASEEAMKHLRAFKEVSGLPTDDTESQNAYHKLKAAIKSARL